jgi:RNA polymerase sigma factor (sigma-70 family)
VNSQTDQQLLREYAGRKSDTAFAELTRRHVDHVYSAALRMVCDAHLAEDVTQGVFLALAQNARGLAERTIISGWLHRTAQNISANTVRSEVRRRTREQEAAAMNPLPANESDVTWEIVAPQLDAAIGELNEGERDALMLRYFERKSAREMAGLLGTSEDAAQKRVNRAIEHLREIFSKRRLIIGAGGLAALISANAVQSAPAGLAAAILGGTALTTQTLGIAMIHKVLIVSATAFAVGLGVYSSHLQRQVKSLGQKQAVLQNQMGQLQQERDDATNRLAAAIEENVQLESSVNQSELLSLRGEVTRLREQIKSATPKETTTIKSPWSNWNNGQTLGSFYAIAGSPTETVAVGIDGHIATRNNGTGNWKVQTFADHHDFRGVAYANNQYVAVSEKGFILTSPDGFEWTRRDSPTRQNLLGIFWDGRQYLVGGDGGTILSSPDGIQWTICHSGGHISVYSFSCSGALYVAVGMDGILTSSDAITWTVLMDAPRVPFTACVWTGNEFLACGLGLDQDPTIYTSTDGDAWALRDQTITASLRAAITVNGVIYVSGDSVVAKSVDGGTTWTNTFKNSGSNRLFMGLANDGENLIAAGFNHNVWSLPLSEAQ